MTDREDKTIRTGGLLRCLAPTLVLAYAAMAGHPTSSEWTLRATTLGGGSMVHSTGSMTLRGTIGQPDAGTRTGGTFELNGGFWVPLPLGDCEDDGDVDLLDYVQLGACLSGPSGGVVRAACRCFDVDHSDAVDLRDVAIVQSKFTGP